MTLRYNSIHNVGLLTPKIRPSKAAAMPSASSPFAMRNVRGFTVDVRIVFEREAFAFIVDLLQTYFQHILIQPMFEGEPLIDVNDGEIFCVLFEVFFAGNELVNLESEWCFLPYFFKDSEGFITKMTIIFRIQFNESHHAPVREVLLLSFKIQPTPMMNKATLMS